MHSRSGPCGNVLEMPASVPTGQLFELNVRGKRKPRTKATKFAAPDGPASKGRPLKRASELARSKKKIHLENHLSPREKLEVYRKDQKPMVSPLEQLPLELLHQIFFLCLEANLARASPLLAQSLSKKTVYEALILFAFFDDDGLHPFDDKVFAPAQYRRLCLEEKLRLQISILNCRWCTLERLQETMPTLSRLAMVQAWHEEHGREQGLDEDAVKSPPITPAPQLRNLAPLPPLDDINAVEQHFLARTSESMADAGIGSTQYSQYLPRIRTWTTSTNKEGQSYKTIDDARGTLNARYIPDKYLTGRPWTDIKLDTLKFLRQGSRFLRSSFVIKISPTALFTGMASAIRERKPHALAVLLELHFAAFQGPAAAPGTGIIAASSSSGRTRFVVPFTHPLPLELFHLATRQGERSAQLVALLLREGIDSVRDDAVITGWAVNSKDAVAAWLLKHMESTQDYRLSEGSSLFVNGSLTWRRGAGDYPFPETSFTEELGYLRDGSLDFRPHGIYDVGDGFESVMEDMRTWLK